MPWYLLRSHGPDENTQIWLEHDLELSEADFEECVMEAARAVVEGELEKYSQIKSDRPHPWWGGIIREVADILCDCDEPFGFRRIQKTAEFSKSWSCSWEDFLPYPDVIRKAHSK